MGGGSAMKWGAHAKWIRSVCRAFFQHEFASKGEFWILGVNSETQEED
jgi:hypothetical protein